MRQDKQIKNVDLLIAHVLLLMFFCVPQAQFSHDTRLGHKKIKYEINRQYHMKNDFDVLRHLFR